MPVEYILLGVAIILGLIGVIYWMLRSADSKNEEALSEHVKEDVQVHERVVKVETKVEMLENEMAKVRDMRHDVIENVSKSLSTYYLDTMDRVRAMIEKLK